MKALTLTQPWASAIVLGIKTIETRSWQTNFRGRIAIHAAKGFPKKAKDFTRQEFILGRFPKSELSLPLGAIIGFANIVAIIRTDDLTEKRIDNDIWFISPEFSRKRTLADREYGDYSLGRFAWFLDQIVQCEPIPCKGALSLWEVPKGILS